MNTNDTKPGNWIIPDNLPIISEEGEQIGVVSNPDYAGEFSIQFFETPPPRSTSIILSPKFEELRFESMVCKFVF